MHEYPHILLYCLLPRKDIRILYDIVAGGGVHIGAITRLASINTVNDTVLVGMTYRK
jgi:hypothetical protein